jgi:hypothetical protein
MGAWAADGRTGESVIATANSTQINLPPRRFTNFCIAMIVLPGCSSRMT